MQLHLSDSSAILKSYQQWLLGRGRQLTLAHFIIEKLPLHHGYAIVAGVEEAARALASYRIGPEEGGRIRGILRQLIGPAESIDEYVRYLGEELKGLRADVVPEGTFVFGSEPIFSLQIPAPHAELVMPELEPLLQRQINVATRFSRMAAQVDGRAKLVDAISPEAGLHAVSVALAACIGGAELSVNPVGDMEKVALVDAATAAILADRESKRVKICLLADDSGDLASIEAALAKAGRCDAVLVDPIQAEVLLPKLRELLAGRGIQIWAGSPALTEKTFAKLVENGVTPDAWVVNSHAEGVEQFVRVSSFSSAIQGPDGRWEALGNHVRGTSFQRIPGLLNVLRFMVKGRPVGDLTINEMASGSRILIDDRSFLPKQLHGEGQPLLVPALSARHVCLFSSGGRALREHCAAQRKLFDKGVLSLEFPSFYACGMEEELYQLAMKEPRS